MSNNTRKKKAIINIIFSLALEIVTVIAGFIIPRLIIGTFGSATNGLINSITSFIGYIALLQSGVGSVVKSALYKPLATDDRNSISVIVKTSEVFFRKIAWITIIYLGILSILFPVFLNKGFDAWYTISLVLIIGMGTVAQYFWGITYQMLFESDQKLYVYNALQIVSIIINTLLTVILINSGCSIQVVKLASAVVFILRPIGLAAYARHHYKLDKNVIPDSSVIKQRWDSFWQAIAYFIHSKTGIFVLTIFSTFANVSIFSVYLLITTGLTSFINAIDKSVRSAFGNVLARGEQKLLNKSFKAYNALLHILSTIIFATAAIMAADFMRVYTFGVTDAQYVQPLFSMIIISAEYIYCLRLPYNSIIYVAGKFKETKTSALIEAGLNIVISITLVNVLGLIGVAVGTLCAMAYRTISFGHFLSSNILELTYKYQLKRFCITGLSYILAIMAFHIFKLPESDNLYIWAGHSVIVFCLVSIIVIAVNFILCKKELLMAVSMLFKSKK